MKRTLVALMMALIGCSDRSADDKKPSDVADTSMPTLDQGQRADVALDAAARDVAPAEDMASPDPDTRPVDASSDAPPDLPVSSVCSPSIGLIAPARVCSPQDRCTHISPLDDPTLAERPSDVPVCATTSGLADGRPLFDDGAPRSATDADGITRYWCEFVPPSAGVGNPLPVVLFLHGTGGGAANVYDATSLRQKAEDTPFILLSPQARNLHVPTEGRTDSAKWDEFHRDLTAPSTNVDIDFLDAMVDSLGPEADPNRIYVMGWSNGGFMAQLYGIARHETSTASGRRIAAVSAYSAADPFHDIVADEPCQLDPYPQSTCPIQIHSRACDIIACDEAQAVVLRAANFGVPPGRVVGTWVSDARDKVGVDIEWVRLSGFFEIAGRVVDSCSANCTAARAATNHVWWPDGIADSSGLDHEPAMLQFLWDNPLP